MEEDNDNVSGDVAMPADAVLVKQAGALEFYFSQAQHVFLLRMAGGQTGPVRFGRPEIIGLLNIFDQQTQEKESALLAELESDEDDF
jgi:hypothetical protein